MIVAKFDAHLKYLGRLSAHCAANMQSYQLSAPTYNVPRFVGVTIRWSESAISQRLLEALEAEFND